MKIFTALILTIGCMAALVAAYPHLDSRHSQALQARKEFNKALSMSRVKLAGVVHRISSESRISGNVQWNQKRSLRGYLEGFLTPGEISAVQIYGADCRLLGGAGSSGVSRRCPPDLTGPHQAFFWSHRRSLPAMGVWKRFSLGQGEVLFAVARVALDREWVRTHPELRRLTEALQLHISPNVPAGGTILQKEGDGAASLITTDLVFRFIPSLAGLTPPPLQQIMAGLLWLTGTGLLLLFFLHKRALRSSGRDQKTMLNWANDLTAASSEDQPEAKLPPVHAGLQQTAARILQLLQEQLGTIRRLRQREEQLQATIDGLQTRLRDSGDDHQAYTRLRFLSGQFSESVPGMKSLVEQIRSGQEDLDDIVNSGITGKASKLASLLAGWQRELQKTSPRKFLRTLSERETESGSNELDVALTFMMKTSQEISTNAINLSLLNKKIRHRTIRVSHCLSLWENLNPGHGDSGDPVKTIRQAATMFDFSKQITGHQILVKIRDVPGTFSKEVPPSVWGAVTYHLFHYLSWQHRAHKDVLGVRVSLMTQNSRPMLVYSPVPGQPQGRDSGSARGPIRSCEQRLQEVREILAQWNIKPVILPVAGSLQAVALPTHPPGMERHAQAGILDNQREPGEARLV